MTLAKGLKLEELRWFREETHPRVTSQVVSRGSILDFCEVGKKINIYTYIYM